MEIDISSLTTRVRRIVESGLSTGPESKTYRDEKSSDLPETREIPISTSSENQVDTSSLDKNKIDYQVDLETKEIAIRLVDRESGKVVRQIPGEEFLQLFSRITDLDKKIIDESV